VSGPLRILAPFVAPAIIRRSIPLLKANIKPQFLIVPIDYTALDFMKSPAAKEIGWSFDVHPEVTAGAFTTSHTALSAVAVALGLAADSIKKTDKDSAHGQVHILDFFKTQAHAYVYHSPWYELPKSVTDGTGLLSLNDPNQFRVFPYNFPTFKAEIDDPKAIVQEPTGFLQSIMGSEPAETSDQAKIRLARWKSRKIGPFVQLGDSSVIAVERYVEFQDEKTGFIIRCGVMATSSFHVFDGRYTWISITDPKNRRTMLGGIGGGQHSIPEMDELNPLGGAVVMSLTIRSYLAGIHAGLKVDAMSPADYAIAIANFDKSLGNQRAVLSQFDRQGVSMALARQSSGMFVHLDKIVTE